MALIRMLSAEVPKAPGYMKGVINLRGTVLPVVDTKIKFDMGLTEFTANTCILVLDIVIDNYPALKKAKAKMCKK